MHKMLIILSYVNRCLQVAISGYLRAWKQAVCAVQSTRAQFKANTNAVAQVSPEAASTFMVRPHECSGLCSS